MKLLTSQLLRYPLVADAASSVRLVVDIQLEYDRQWDLAHLDVSYSITSSLPAFLTSLSLKISQLQNLSDLLLNISSSYNGGALILDKCVPFPFHITASTLLIHVASRLKQSLLISELLIHNSYLDQSDVHLLYLAEALQVNSRLTKLQLSNVNL